ncbi:MAG TPA: sulfatase [Vicinamibacterales bacterium]|nr:sulfatase [Vicinamibacterales bacterium]
MPSFSSSRTAWRATVLAVGLFCWSGAPPADYFPLAALPMSALAPVGIPSDLPDVVADVGAGRIRVGRESRPGRLVKGPQRIVRSVDVPFGGARLDVALAPIRRAATLRVLADDVEVARVKALPGVWNPVSVDLPYSLRSTRVVEELIASPEGLVFWSDDRLVRKWPVRSRPDVIVISLDTVRPDYLTPYNPGESTPALAAFAKDATRFDQAISVSSWTLPAHEAIFTGTYPSIDGGRLDARDATLAELFASAGYDTFGVSSGPFTDSTFGFQRGFRSYLDSIPGKHAADTTSAALDWIEHTSKATPVFAFLNYFDAHEPNTGLTTAEWLAMDSRAFHWTPEAVARIRGAYRQDVRSLDREVGRLFDGIRRTRDWRNTVVVVLGDHGQLLGERGMIGHALRLDEELIHVPLLVKAAGNASLPDHYAEQIQLTDVLPLVTELAGIPVDQEPSSVARISAGLPIRPLAFAQVRHPASEGLLDSSQWASESLQLVRTDTLRAIRDAEGHLSLTTTTDSARLLDTATMPSLFLELDAFAKGSQPGGALRVRPEVLKRLRALGYIR